MLSLAARLQVGLGDDHSGLTGSLGAWDASGGLASFGASECQPRLGGWRTCVLPNCKVALLDAGAPKIITDSLPSCCRHCSGESASTGIGVRGLFFPRYLLRLLGGRVGMN